MTFIKKKETSTEQQTEERNHDPQLKIKRLSQRAIII